jgi:hypothetical protein
MSYKNYKVIALTPNTTNTLGQLVLGGIHINKAMTGTLVIKDGSVTLGTIAAATVAGTFWDVAGGAAFGNLVIVSNSAADDVSVSVTAV